MTILLLLVPISVLLLGGAIAAFAWAVRSGQFDDLDTPAVAMLADVVPPPPDSSHDVAQAAAGNGLHRLRSAGSDGAWNGARLLGRLAGARSRLLDCEASDTSSARHGLGGSRRFRSAAPTPCADRKLNPSSKREGQGGDGVRAAPATPAEITEIPHAG